MTNIARETREAITIPDDTKDTEFNLANELIYFEEGATIVKRDTYASSFILGSSSNGILGTSTLGASGRVESILSVTSPNNRFREHFRDTTFKSGANTADWNTTLFRLAMSTSSNHATAYANIATSSSIALNDGTVSRVTVRATESRWNLNDIIQYFITADGGNNWKEVSLNTDTTLTYTGTDLRFRVIFIGNGGSETYIEDLTVEYV